MNEIDERNPIDESFDVAKPLPPHELTERMLGREKIYMLKSSVAQFGSPDEIAANLHKLQSNEIGYQNYGFTAEFNARALNLVSDKHDLKKMKEYELVRELCRDPQVIKIPLVHGWSANRSMWNTSAGSESWIDGLMRRCNEQGIPALIINMDSNGWGESQLTKKMVSILQRGPIGWLREKNHMAVTDKDLLHKWHQTGDQFSRDSMPGSVAFASEAVHVLLDTTLGVQGPTVPIMHSQGDKIMRAYIYKDSERMRSLKGYNEAHHKSFLGYGLAGAELARDIPIDTLPLFRLLNLAQQPTIRKILRSGAAGAILNTIGNLSTAFFGADDVPWRKKLALMAMHGKEIGRAVIDQTVSQAIAWSSNNQPFFSEVDRPNPFILQRIGRDDRLIPAENFSEWQNTSMYYTRLMPLDRLFSCSVSSVTVYSGSHYFFFKPKEQDEILDAIVSDVQHQFVDTPEHTSLIQEASEVIHQLEVDLQGNDLGLVRFIVLPESEVKGALHERVHETIQRAHDRRLPRLCPTTARETMALKSAWYHLPQFATVRFIGGQANTELQLFVKGELRKQSVAAGNMDDEDALMNLIDMFPLDLYASGIRDVASLRNDIQREIGEVVRSREHEENEFAMVPGTSQHVVDAMVRYFEINTARQEAS